MTHLQVFQLQIQPVVQLRTHSSPGQLDLEAVDCELEGLGLVDDFQLTLKSWIKAVNEPSRSERVTKSKSS